MGLQQTGKYGLAVAVLLAGAAIGGGQAHAAPTTFLKTYEETGSATCPSNFKCTVYFSLLSVPVRIVKVSCRYSFNGTSPLTSLTLGDANASKSSYTEWQYLDRGHLVLLSSSYGLQTLSRANHVVAAGSRPAVNMNFSTYVDSTITCSIAGNM